MHYIKPHRPVSARKVQQLKQRGRKAVVKEKWEAFLLELNHRVNDAGPPVLGVRHVMYTRIFVVFCPLRIPLFYGRTGAYAAAAGLPLAAMGHRGWYLL